MRGAVLALLVGAGLVFAVGLASWERPAAYGQRTGSAPAAPPGAAARTAQAGDLMVLASDAADGRQQVVLIDAKSRAMGVYHIDRASGQVALRSVRNVHWDLQIDDFNGGSPSPQEIKSLLPPR